jgi:hypothetical protein
MYLGARRPVARGEHGAESTSSMPRSRTSRRCHPDRSWPLQYRTAQSEILGTHWCRDQCDHILTVAFVPFGSYLGNAVRYAWADNPEVSLFSKAGLPAAPL